MNRLTLFLLPFLFHASSLDLLSHIALADDAGSLISQSEAESIKSASDASGLVDDLRNNAKGAPLSVSVSQIVAPLNVGVVEHVKQEKVKDTPLSHEGQQKCKGTSSGSGKCPLSLLGVLQNLEDKKRPMPSPHTQLLIFVSQSMPENSIKAFWEQGRKIGAKLLFRGLIGGTFKETQQYIKDLGIVADIDPTKFDEYQVTQVPTFVLFRTNEFGTDASGSNAFGPASEPGTEASGKNTSGTDLSGTNASSQTNFDKVTGHISLLEVLDQFRKKGDLKEEANRLYDKLKEGRS